MIRWIDIDEVRQLDPVHQVDHKDEFSKKKKTNGIGRFWDEIGRFRVDIGRFWVDIGRFWVDIGRFSVDIGRRKRRKRPWPR